jgi:hypothetical protein
VKRIVTTAFALAFLAIFVNMLFGAVTEPTVTTEQKAAEQAQAIRLAEVKAKLLVQQIATLEPRLVSLASIASKDEQKAEAKRIASELKQLRRTEETIQLIDAWRSHPVVLKLAAEETDAAVKLVRAEWPKTRKELQRAFADRVDRLLIDTRVESKTDVITLKGKPALRVTSAAMGRVLSDQLANKAELAHRAEEVGFYAFVAENSISGRTFTWTLEPKEQDPAATAKREIALAWFLED